MSPGKYLIVILESESLTVDSKIKLMYIPVGNKPWAGL